MFCENCGQKIEDTDKVCRYCGMSVLPPEPPKEPSEDSSRLFIFLGIGGGVLLVAIIAVVATFIIKGKNVQDSAEASNEIQAETVTETPVPTETPAETPAETPTETPTPTPEPTEEITYTTMYVVNCKESITLRTSPSTSASEICQIPLGAAVSYVETVENGFYKIIYNGKTGYSIASYLDTTYHQTYQTNTSSASTPSYATMYVVNCKESITLRTSPSTSASEICQIPLGASVSYVEEAKNGFYKIIYNGKTGYSLASYLSYSSELNMPYGYILVVVNCKESITLRTSPSTSASEICQIPLGSTVEFLEYAENGFYKVNYIGKTGYALASYLG